VANTARGLFQLDIVFEWIIRHWVDLAGYLAAFLMFSTFYMKKMIPLRAVGASSNLVFIVYTLGSDFYLNQAIWPLFILHAALFPLNITRMIQMIRLVKKVREASSGNFAMDFLIPFMTQEEFKKGDFIFRKGDEADKLYFLRDGLLRLVEIEIYVEKGELIGEVGLFSENKLRTASLLCDSDAQLLSIPKKQVLQLYYQNPKFGFYLVKLIVNRLLHNVDLVKNQQELTNQ